MADDAPVPASRAPGFNDTRLIRLARELAMDIRPIQDVLKSHGMTEAEWETVSASPRFRQYLGNFVEEWQAAGNTPERVKLKSLAFVEESLVEFYARAHDPNEPLSAKTEVLKTVARFAGVGAAADSAITGEKFSVTINLGSDQTVKIERDVTPRGNLVEGSMDE